MQTHNKIIIYNDYEKDNILANFLSNVNPGPNDSLILDHPFSPTDDDHILYRKFIYYKTLDLIKSTYTPIEEILYSNLRYLKNLKNIFIFLDRELEDRFHISSPQVILEILTNIIDNKKYNLIVMFPLSQVNDSENVYAELVKMIKDVSKLESAKQEEQND